MADSKFNAKDLLQKYEAGTCNDEEKELIETVYNLSHIEKTFDLPEDQAAYDLEEIWLNIQAGKKKRYLLRYLKPLSIAATVFLISGICYYYFTRSHQVTAEQSQIISDVLPGSNKAILTLNNGRKINLSNTGERKLDQQQGVAIVKTQAGELVYTLDQKHKTDRSALDQNSVETPRGGKYQVRLGDGTKVWLNADSKLTYPVSFTGRGQRVVFLSGEAYFEVAHNKAQPFIVKTPFEQVQVLGTHFNINCYREEKKSATTLLEGAVSIRPINAPPTREKILSPGEQAILSKNNLSISEADIETTLGWKNDLFVFKDADIPTIMHQIARWYNVAIEYRGAVPKDRFTGGISMHSNLSTVLKMLEMIQIKFQIVETPQEKKLIINP